MRRVIPVGIGVALALLSVSCRSKDVRTMAIDVPAMRNEACATLISNALVRVPGIESGGVVVDLESRQVVVSYDSLMLSLKNVEFTIADLGFAANDIPANKEAEKKLPPDCRE